MQLKRNKGLEFDTLKKSHKKQIIIGALVICVVGGALTFTTSRARYKLTQDIPLVRGTVNYKVPDLRIVALYTANDNGDYVEANNIPTSGYTLNQEKSMCKVYDGTTSIENAPRDSKAVIEYKNGTVTFANITKKNTRCYLYFDKNDDTIAPTVDNIEVLTSKTEIFVTVSASDNNSVTEYWYALDSDPFEQETSSNPYIHAFTNLKAGSSHTIKVYVKDEAGNVSSTVTKTNVNTLPNDITIINRSDETPNFSYSTDNGNTWNKVTSNVASITIPIGTLIKSNLKSITFCSTDISSCKATSATYLGEGTISNTYKVTGDEVVFNYTCLAEETLITVYDEENKKKKKKKIKDIKVGDKVYSYDNKKKEIILATVKKVEVVKANIVCEIKLENGEIIRCSQEHGFYIENREFMMAKELTKGLKIMGMDGINYKIDDVKIVKYSEGIDLYNILLDQGNNIFVTSLKVMSYTATFMVGFNVVTKKNIVLGSSVEA